MPNYIFFDIDTKLLAAYTKAIDLLTDQDWASIGGSVRVMPSPTDVRQITGINVYVSPANSYGWMDGGIDAIYSKMWPGVGKLVQEAIRKRSPFRTVYDRCALPVGSALLVDLSETHQSEKESKDLEDHTTNRTDPKDPQSRLAIVCAPTMMSPRNISQSPENIYFAMYSILRACEHLGPEYNVGIPGLGTGVGGVSGEDSAIEILCAFKDYAQKSSPPYPSGSHIKVEPGTYLVTPPFLK